MKELNTIEVEQVAGGGLLSSLILTLPIPWVLL
jgi:hypothetical protein